MGLGEDALDRLLDEPLGVQEDDYAGDQRLAANPFYLLFPTGINRGTTDFAASLLIRKLLILRNIPGI